VTEGGEIGSSRPGPWQEATGRLAARSLAAGDPMGWFDALYDAGAAGEITMPWDRVEAHPLLVDWAHARAIEGTRRRAVVVGSGLGADAERTAGLGFETTAFDISPRAVELARARFPDSAVHYVVGDLLDPPPGWLRGFDLVVEIITAQALPDPPRRQAIVNVGRLVAPRGTLLAIEAIDSETEPANRPPPWPLVRAEIDAFATDGLTCVSVEQINGHWRAEFTRPTEG
jgi:SAM-dependent methyltransferase